MPSYFVIAHKGLQFNQKETAPDILSGAAVLSLVRRARCRRGLSGQSAPIFISWTSVTGKTATGARSG